MKKIVVFIFTIVANFYCLCQEIKPMAKGFITVTTGQKMAFSNLRVLENQVVFMNDETKTEFTYFVVNIKQIEDEKNNILYTKVIATKKEQSISQTEVIEKDTPQIKKVVLSKLEFVNSSKILLDGKKLDMESVRAIMKTNNYALENFNSGKTYQTIGNISIGAGVGLIVYGGLSNMKKSNTSSDNPYSSEAKSNGSPGLIIAGIVVGLIGIPLKVVGSNKVQESISDYNQKPVASAKNKTLQMKLIASASGIGFTFGF
jgi:hypothetical protein